MANDQGATRLGAHVVIFSALAIALGLAVSGVAQATPISNQNFSSNTNGWNTEGSSSITLAAQSGSSEGQYAVVTNARDDYQPSYGDGGYTYFNGPSSSYTGPFTQSVDIYIDTSWAAPTAPGTAAFWLDMSPHTTGAGSDFAAENSFNFYVPGNGTISIGATGGPTAWSISTSGWYTFAMTFSKGASPTDPVQIALNVLNQSGTSLGTVNRLANNNLGYDPSSSLLGGVGYAWLTVWQNGFAGDQLSIDNLQLDAVPAPLSTPWSGLALLGLGGLAIVLLRRRVGAD